MAKLYFEDINIGDEVPPYSVQVGYMELNRFASANDEFVLIHMDPDYSKDIAKIPDVNIMGNLKLVYIANALMGWIGDDGWIRNIGAEYRKQDFVHHVLTAKGIVRAKRIEDGESLVDLDMWVENDNGETTTPGYATVILPNRSAH